METIFAIAKRIRTCDLTGWMKSSSFAAKDFLLCLMARALLRLARIVPFSLVLRVGRAGGELFYWVDGRHRKVALRNLERCFAAEKSKREIGAIARENFRRIGENLAGALKSFSVETADLRRRLEITAPKEFTSGPSALPCSRILAIGHFGNFELFVRITEFLPRYRGATTYRGIPYPKLERLLKSWRAQSGCQLFERRREGREFRSLMRTEGVLFGLTADQNAASGRLRLPFLGQDCWTSAAPALFALRFKRPLHVGICHRVGLGRWQIEVSNEIPTRVGDVARPAAEIMADVNRTFEQAIHRDPANWFWVHKRWKAPPAKAQIAFELPPRAVVKPDRPFAANAAASGATAPELMLDISQVPGDRSRPISKSRTRNPKGLQSSSPLKAA
jgi:lauroyl/myristoyl acyltransferase